MAEQTQHILLWNVEWANPDSERGRILTQHLANREIICLTESSLDLLPDEGHTITSDPDYGYPHDGSRRKVLLWSREPWKEVDIVGDPGLPSGRFVSGITGDVRFVGVCIPWKDAHVKTGRKDRQPWEDHLAYCRGLSAILERLSQRPEPVCILGDFNQRFPRKWQPEHVYKALRHAIPTNYTVATKGLKDPQGKQLIDHLVTSPGLSMSHVQTLNRITGEGTRLSDHTGISAISHNQHNFLDIN
jgi:hypothetical protein